MSKRQGNKLKIENQTQAFQVDGAEIIERSVRLSLRNNYDKKITAYTVSVGILKMEEDFIYSDKMIEPGETYTVDISIPSSNSPVSSSVPDVKILAVFFDDRTSDGLASIAADIQARRSGEKVQIARAVRFLRKALDSPDSDVPAALARLKSQVSSLPVPSEYPTPIAVSSGLSNGKEDAVRMISELEENPHNPSGLTIREKLEKKMSVTSTTSKVVVSL